MFVPCREEKQALVPRTERKKHPKRDQAVSKVKRGSAGGFACAGLRDRFRGRVRQRIRGAANRRHFLGKQFQGCHDKLLLRMQGTDGCALSGRKLEFRSQSRFSGVLKRVGERTCTNKITHLCRSRQS